MSSVPNFPVRRFYRRRQTPDGLMEEADPGSSESSIPERLMFVPITEDRRSSSQNNGNIIPGYLLRPGSSVLWRVALIWMPYQGPIEDYLHNTLDLSWEGSPSSQMGHPLTPSSYQPIDMIIIQEVDLMRMGRNVRIAEAMLADEPEFHDRHEDMSFDIDRMSYEQEMLGFEEQIGSISTGLAEDTVQKNLERRKYRSSEGCKSESCCICQEDYADGEDLGVLTCGHDFHASCVGKWLLQKNVCPLCKSTALPS